MIPAVDNLQASEQPLSFDFVRKLIGRRSMDAHNFSQIIPLGEFLPPWQKLLAKFTPVSAKTHGEGISPK
jgi:hypothetical protein